MKTRISLSLLFILLFTTSCDLYEDIFDKDKNESFIADVSSDTDYDLLVYSGEDDSYILIKQENDLPVEALVKTPENSDPYPVWFNTNGFPDKIVIREHILLFDNYTKTSFDLAIISPSGDVNVVREIRIPEKYQEFLLLKSARLANVLKWTGNTLSLVSCALSVFGGGVATLTSFGIGTPAAVALVSLGCGAAVFGAVIDAVGGEKISEYTKLPLKTIKGFTTTITCVTGKGLNCLVGLAGLITGTAGMILEEKQNATELAEAALAGGYGDIQVTLTWDSPADIDLYVQDPSGEMIWYGNKTSSSGGWLDADDTDGYGPENIFWDKNEAPSGIYKVFVKHYDGTSANYSVLVQAFGRSKKFSGKIDIGQQLAITDFSKNYLKKAGISQPETALPVAVK